MAARLPILASLWDTIPLEAQAAILEHVASLEQRIADLEAENADLRRLLAQVEHQLQNIRRRAQRPSQRRDPVQGPHTDRRRKEYRQHPGNFPTRTRARHRLHRTRCLSEAVPPL